jgi:hypothetical protein
VEVPRVVVVMTKIQNDGPADLEARTRISALVWAWGCYLFLPVSFFFAFAAGHLPYLWFGYAEGEPGPWWFNLLAGVIAFGVLWIPVGLSMLAARTAIRAGSRAAWVPLVIGLVLTAAVLVALVVATFQ